jgi:hypothetical protein
VAKLVDHLRYCRTDTSASSVAVQTPFTIEEHGDQQMSSWGIRGFSMEIHPWQSVIFCVKRDRLLTRIDALDEALTYRRLPTFDLEF